MTTEIVRRSLTKSRSDASGVIFRTLLQLALLITIVVLLVLLLDVVTGAIDGGSMNPARSLGAAVFADTDPNAGSWRFDRDQPISNRWSDGCGRIHRAS